MWLECFFFGSSNLKCGLNDPMALFVAKKGVTSINKEQHPSVKVSARLMNLHRFAAKQLQGIVVQLSRWWFQIFLYIFYVHPYLGKILILTNIFQRGWFNHQAVVDVLIFGGKRWKR